MNLEEPSQVFPERRLEQRQVDQVVGFPNAHEASVFVESGARDQAMDMGMKSQPLVPGVEDRRETAGGGAQSLGRRQLLGQSARDGPEEQIERFLGEGAEEAGPQLFREREGDQEVGCLDELLLLALDPLSRGRPDALGAGLVITGVPGEVDLAAIRAGQSPSAHRRSSAVRDGPKGATLISRERRLGGQELR